MAENTDSSKPKSISSRIVTLATIIAATVAGVAAFSTNVLSIRSSLSNLFATPAVQPPELALRDVRGVWTKASASGQAEALVEMILDHKGTASNCWAELLMRPPRTYRMSYPKNLAFGEGTFVVDLVLGKGVQVAIGLPFSFPKVDYSKQAKVRMICEFSIVTSWASFEMADFQDDEK